MASSGDLPFNAEVLRWARELAGIDYEQAAKRINKAPEDIRHWEEGRGQPTVRQARTLAALYNRPFLEFFLPARPTLPEPTALADFRTHAGRSRHDSQALAKIRLWAEQSRNNALDLYDVLREDPPRFPKRYFGTLEDSPEELAESARKVVGPEISEQIGLPVSRAHIFPRLLRDTIESVGTLVLRNTDLEAEGARGICIAEFPLPVMVFSGDDPPQAQAFTILHEFAHVALRESGISGDIPKADAHRREATIERWCNRYAAAFLMPRQVIAQIVGNPPPVPAKTFEDAQLTAHSRAFKVSRQALLLRLIHLRYVAEAFYWSKANDFDAERRGWKAFGRSKYYGARYVNAHGQRLTRLVLHAWEEGRITDHGAGRFLGIRNLNHLDAIKADLLRGEG